MFPRMFSKINLFKALHLIGMKKRKEFQSNRKTSSEKRRPFGSNEKRSFQKKVRQNRPGVSIENAPSSTAGPNIDKGIQLNKFLSNAGIASRRACAELIKEGLVTVNEKVVTESGYRVQRNDNVKYKGEKIVSAKKYYVLLNKPKDYITTLSDEHGRKTVMELIEKATPARLYPVGRLDRNTTGLLLFTNDGALAQNLTHPSKKVKKVYEVTLDKDLTSEDMDKVSSGMSLDDGIALVDEIAYADLHDKRIIGIELHIGKNRIVRRIFEKLGYDVVKLDRVLYAGLTKKNLPRGRWRFLTEREIRSLKYFL